MLGALKGIAGEGFIVDTSSNTIRFERLLNVPPKDVFAAWTEPRQVQSWWDPNGLPLAKCEIDLRVGGSFAFTLQAHPRAFTGTYRTIEAPRQIVFEALGADGRVMLFSADANQTRMVVEIVCSSPEHLQQFLEEGVGDGTTRTLNNLVAYTSC